MDTVIVFLRLLALSQVMLFGLVLWFSPNPLKIRGAGSILLIGIAAYLIAPMVASFSSGSLLLVVTIMATLVPSFLLVFVWYLFEEDPVPVWLAVFVGLAIVITTQYFANTLDERSIGWLFYSLQASKVLSFCLSIWVILWGRDDDLVILRRRMRDALSGGMLLIAIGVVLAEFFTGFQVPPQIEVAGMLIIFTASILFNFVFIRLNPTAKLVGDPIQAQPKASEDQLVIKLLDRMRKDRLYADHDLRVSSLADTLRVPEYQLRKRINQHLGYRNFNQFVNRYRVEEAAERLIGEPTLPVLTIALDVGFRSISSFNTSFLAHFGISPTQYRNKTDQ